jgi:uncharacterized protein
MTLSPGVEVPTAEIARICERFEARELAIFGSAARGEMQATSDVDLLVEFQPDAKIGLLRFAELEEELAATLGRRVDLVSKGGLKRAIRSRVLAEARVLYAAPHKLTLPGEAAAR